MGVVIDAETGTVVGGAGNKRHSQRRHTMLNTSLTDLRIKGEMEKKVNADIIYSLNAKHVFY